MTSFGKASRVQQDLLPHHGAKPLTAEILSHEESECRFHPELPPDGVRDKLEKSTYGPEYTPPKPKAAPEPSKAELRKSFTPNTDVSQVSKVLKQAVPSSRYGQKPVKGVYESRMKKKDEIRPKPTFKPKTNSDRLKAEIPSSGYTVNGGYVPPVPKRGEAARKPENERQYSFQPQLHLSKKAKELAKQVKQKYPNGKRVEQDEWHERPRVPRVYTPKKWEAPSTVMVSKARYSADDVESYDTGGFILDSVAFGTRGASDYSSYRGAHIDVDKYGVSTRRKMSPQARPKTTEYDIHGRPKGEPIFDPESILTNRK